MLREWRRFLESSSPAHTSGTERAGWSIRRVADARLWKAYRRVIRDGRAIGSGTPAEQLHRLRKDCKKLRYLLEFFASLYPSAHVKPMIRQLKQLLDNLGQFQDLHVQAEKLQGFARDMSAREQAELPLLLAIGALIGNLLERQQAARRHFAELFAVFDEPERERRCRALFKEGARA
jgi:CHAD domain-containing protein